MATAEWLTRLARIEARGSNDTHLCVLELASNESIADALARLGLRGIASIGIVAPADLDAETWEAQAIEMHNNQHKGHRWKRVSGHHAILLWSPIRENDSATAAHTSATIAHSHVRQHGRDARVAVVQTTSTIKRCGRGR